MHHKSILPKSKYPNRTRGLQVELQPEEAKPYGIAVSSRSQGPAGHGEAGNVAGAEVASAMGQHVAIEVSERPRRRRRHRQFTGGENPSGAVQQWSPTHRARRGGDGRGAGPQWCSVVISEIAICMSSLRACGVLSFVQFQLNLKLKKTFSEYASFFFLY